MTEIGRMYSWGLYPTDKDTLVDAIRHELKRFVSKYGYMPDYAVVNVYDYDNNAKYPITLHVEDNCQTHHFILVPWLTHRYPRILNCRRTPV